MQSRRIHIAIVNGPNLNLIGKREPAIYGCVSFDDYMNGLREKYKTISLDYFQSNHEGDLIDYLQQADSREDLAGIVLNAGGYTHTSIALRDTVAAIGKRVVEVHISDLTKREAFRQISYLQDVVCATFTGYGLQSYDKGIDFLLQTTTE